MPPRDDWGKPNIGSTTQQITLLSCPACDKPITGTVHYAIEGTAKLAKRFDADLVIKGVRVNGHDCIPKVTR